MNKVAVMQPYFFPYIGYWQLINNVDRFIIYDDVNFIKGGWVNRNRILVNGSPIFLTIPLVDASPNKKIRDIEIFSDNHWKEKLLKTIQLSYKKSPFFSEIFPLIQEIIFFDEKNLSNFLVNQIKMILDFLEIDTHITITSTIYHNSHLSGNLRVLDICKQENADCYVNLIGGRSIYDEREFKELGMDLFFIESERFKYDQKSSEFIASLSIIDLLMSIGPNGVKSRLANFDLIKG